mgnify:CR=1 FL=1
MTSLDLLLSRFSTDALVQPAPDAAQLERILSAAMCAPDHGRLRPWRYVVIRDEARARAAELVVASMKRLDPEVAEAKIEKRRGRFSTMPLVIALGMHLRPDHKIPLIEQEMAVAAAAMNVLNALHFTGFGAVWVSGDVTYDPQLAAELGFEAPHRLAGFLFVGTPGPDARPARRASVEGYVAQWEGAGTRFAADEKDAR